MKRAALVLGIAIAAVRCAPLIDFNGLDGRTSDAARDGSAGDGNPESGSDGAVADEETESTDATAADGAMDGPAPALDARIGPSSTDALPVDGGDDGAADGGPPDAVLPDATLPDAALPGATLPDATLPDATLPDATLPDAALPDAASLADATSDDGPLADAEPDVRGGDAHAACDGVDAGWYCATDDLGTYSGNLSDLVYCDGARIGSVQSCPNGCVTTPPYHPDTCDRCAGKPDGLYCARTFAVIGAQTYLKDLVYRCATGRVSDAFACAVPGATCEDAVPGKACCAPAADGGACGE